MIWSLLKARHTRHLVAAVNVGDASKVDTLVTRGANVDARTDDGCPLLIRATEKNRLDIVQTLIDHGVDLNARRQDSATALLVAALNARSAIVRTLINNGADVNATMKDGATALFWASMEGHQDVVRLLLEGGPDLNSRYGDDQGTPLWIAAYNGHVEVVQTLLDSGADLDATTSGGLNALHAACVSGQQAVVRELLSRGVNPNRAANGTTPLYLAAEEGNYDVVHTLLESGAGVNTPIDDGRTPLFAAAGKGHSNIVQALIGKGADINAKRNDGATALVVASSGGFPGIACELLERGADPNAACTDGATAIFAASSRGHHELVRALISKGANSDVRFQGQTPLVIASLRGHYEVVRILLAGGANPNARNDDGATPLHFASLNGHQQVARALIERGAAIDVKLGEATPLDLALAKGHHAVAAVLRNYRSSEFVPAKPSSAVHQNSASASGQTSPKSRVVAAASSTSPFTEPNIVGWRQLRAGEDPPSVWLVPVGNGIRDSKSAAEAQAILYEMGSKAGGRISPRILFDIGAREANKGRYPLAGEIFSHFYRWIDTYNQDPNMGLAVAAGAALCFTRMDGRLWPPSPDNFPPKVHANISQAVANLGMMVLLGHAHRRGILRATGGKGPEADVVIGSANYHLRTTFDGHTLGVVASPSISTNSQLAMLIGELSTMGLTLPCPFSIAGAQDWW